MPYRKKFAPKRRPTRPNRRPRAKKVVRSTRNFARLPKQLPPKMVTTMRYATTLRLDPGTLIQVPYNHYSCNSIYDPDATGTGHQPYTHDTFQTLYNHYKVLKSSIKATFLSNGNLSTGNIVGGIAVMADTTAIGSDFDTIRERAASKFKVALANSRSITVTAGYNHKKMYPTNVANLNSAFGTSPSEQAYFCVWATAANPTVDNSACDIVITIDYTVLMWELKPLSQS